MPVPMQRGAPGGVQRNNKSKKAKPKTTGCLSEANKYLKKRNEKPLSEGDSKNLQRYREVSRGFEKRKILDEKKDSNPGLATFVAIASRVPEIKILGTGPGIGEEWDSTPAPDTPVEATEKEE
ncbi:MAG: hypothetical protein HY791_01105 [Deltaproteobacteria bacterium]|nr:hypothetical protein [Deltaproteobacteria bacterium]